MHTQLIDPCELG